MKVLPIALGGILIVTAAFAQATLPPPGGPQAQDAGPPPPPPGERGPRGPKGDRPPPPPRGAAIRIEHSADGIVRLEVKCAESDTTKDCADVAAQLLDKLSAATARR
jgi:hypothetical protein